MLSHQGNFYCKAPKNSHVFFTLPKKSFSVFNKAPSDTLKNFFWQNYLLFFFKVHEKWVLYQSGFLFCQYTDGGGGVTPTTKYFVIFFNWVQPSIKQFCVFH